MSFWQGLKAMFGLSKDIGISEDISGYLIYPLKLKHKKLVLNRNLIVPENFALVIVSEGKILDVFPAGEHMLGVISLPEASKKFKLYKPDKDGNPVNEFTCDAFYVNLGLKKNQPFEIRKKLKFKTSVDGRYWIKPKGEISFLVKDVKLFFANILQQMPKIKLNKLDVVLAEFFEKPLIETFETENYLYSSFTENLDVLEENLLPKLNKHISRCGVEVSRIDFLSHEVSSNITKREEKKKQEEEEKNIKQQKAEFERESEFLNPNIKNKPESELENNPNAAKEENKNWQGLESFSKGEVDLRALGNENDYKVVRNQFAAQQNLNGGANQKQGEQDSFGAAGFGEQSSQAFKNTTQKSKWAGFEEVNKAIQNKKYVDLNDE